MQVKILSNEEFEALPYPDMSRSLGVADPRTRTAYVRETGLPILDAFNLAHELEHLKDGEHGVHADHYRNGVYYKDMTDAFITAGSMIPGPWQPVAMAGGYARGRQAQKKERSRQSAMEQDFMNGMGGEQPITESFRPSVEQPNVIQAGGGQGVGIGDAGLNHQPAGAIERVRGFFSGRNPL